MKRFFIALFFVYVSAHAQQFELKPVDKSKIANSLAKGETEDEFYLYLVLNYRAVGEMTSVKYDTDFENKPLCAFTRKFESGITYKVNKCGEATGTEMIVTLPKTDITKVKKWIEQLYSISGNQIKNVWDKSGFTYQPDDGGAGCYYNIKQIHNKTTIKSYCGC